MTPLLSVEHLTKHFPTRHGVVRAVEDVSFTVAAGETLALVGESGCGKTTVALSLLRLLRPDSGRVSFEGVDLEGGTDKAEKAWRQRLSIVFQNPYSSLDPRMRIRNIVGEPLITAYGLRGRALTERVVRHLGEVGLGAEHLTRFPHEFSGGQRQRIAIARALALEPKLLILDEPTAALDVSVQAQVLNLLQGLQKSMGLSYLFISHNLATVENIADRVLVMYLGRVVEEGPVEQGLRDALPSLYPRASRFRSFDGSPAARERLRPVSGEIPSALNPPPGCAFSPRCTRAGEECRAAPPPLMAAGPGAATPACIRFRRRGEAAAERLDAANEGRTEHMKLEEYAGYDALGLARLVERREVSPRDLAETALKAIEAVNPKLHAVIEIYADRIAALDGKTLGRGPFRGVPFLIKDVGPHLKGRKTEFCSRLVPGHGRRGGQQLRHAAQGLGRQHPGPDQHARILHGKLLGESALRQHLDTLEAGIFGQRLDGRRRGGRRGGRRPHGPWLGHWRIDPGPRRLVRRHRPQALARTHLLGPAL